MAFMKGILIGISGAVAGVKDRALERKLIAKMATIGPESNVLLARAMYTSALHTLVPWMKARVKANRSVFRGQLHQRINAKSRVKSATTSELDFGAMGIRYAYNVEKGAGPHTANANKIRSYVTKKMGLRGEDATTVAIAIWETIKDEGSKPYPFVMPIWDAGKENFRRDVVRRMAVALHIGLKK
jgi:hypothetical protein